MNGRNAAQDGYEIGLHNCASEPIHVPGSIQPHGALLAFDRAGALIAWSANADALLGVQPLEGQTLQQCGLPDEMLAALDLQALQDDGIAQSVEATIAGRLFDVVAHRHRGATIIEFEQRALPSDEVAAFALRAHRAIDRLRHQRTIEGLLQMAVEQLRAITGFDRVMAYRFRHDDSGDVIAEARTPELEPYRGLRYPASDIPAQARRLYLINTLRLIADVGYRPVPLVGSPQARSLDLSHCVLRSVSPIHVEYLQNIDVGASMSVSIVVGGRLWGLIACHHRQPHQVPYSIRMACDVLAQVLAAKLQGLTDQTRVALTERATGLRTTLIEGLLNDDEPSRVFAAHEAGLREVLQAEAIVVGEYGRIVPCGGTLEPAIAEAVLQSLPEGGDDLVHRHRRELWPPALRERIGRWVGLLALRVDPPANGWLVLLRPEQVQTVRWGGRPDKEVRIGPLGPRLTPRGSFAEWREEVRDTAEPWDDALLALARQLLAEVHRASDRRRSELERARMQMLAMLGHDLRDPLHSITMAAKVLESGHHTPTIGRIQSSSSRMSRLISQVLDMTRLESGSGLQLARRTTDLGGLLRDLIDEAQTAFPATRYQLDGATALTMDIDADRFAQVISNLLSNARHHGDPQTPIRVVVADQPDRVTIDVINAAEPIPDALAAQLFTPFKRRTDNQRHRSGLGLGLYISRRIALEHGGDLRYAYRAPDVVFTVELPR
ncbi:MAG TPA: GAF domain-containing protein [Burkholderiaceae bacterium]|nr:GAF domain-containing protein [Burkholderiaceae bacterium]